MATSRGRVFELAKTNLHPIMRGFVHVVFNCFLQKAFKACKKNLFLLKIHAAHVSNNNNNINSLTLFFHSTKIILGMAEISSSYILAPRRRNETQFIGFCRYVEQFLFSLASLFKLFLKFILVKSTLAAFIRHFVRFISCCDCYEIIWSSFLSLQ